MGDYGSGWGADLNSTARLGLGMAAGGSELGYGLSMDPTLQQAQMPSNAGDQQAVQQQMQQQQGITNQNMTDINNLYGTMGPQMINNMAQQLGPNGTAGKTLQGEFNNLGLLDSGAFNVGLANQFLPLQQQLLQGQTSADQGVINQGAQTQSGLGLGGLQRQFGLEDTGTQDQMTQNLAQFLQQSQLQNALVGGGSNILGQTVGGSSGSGSQNGGGGK